MPGAYVLPAGPMQNPDGLLVLGAGPTRDEWKAQEPLVGLTAKELITALEEAGIQRERILVANAYACMPKEPRRDKEERLAVACCRPLLASYVSRLPPETPTLLAGKWAQLAMTGTDKGLFNRRGFVDMKWDLTSGLNSKVTDKQPPEE